MTDIPHSHADHPGAPAHRGRVLEQLLEEAGVVTGEELDEFLDKLPATRSPANGARVVARAWCDDDYRARLLEDAGAAVAELGYPRAGYVLQVVENTEPVHNVVVCTLCSCYPLALLGPSPSWYRSSAYRARAVRDPRGVLAEFGFDPGDVAINVWDANADTRYMVLPRRPSGTEALTEPELAERVTRRGLIGTAAV